MHNTTYMRFVRKNITYLIFKSSNENCWRLQRKNDPKCKFWMSKKCQMKVEITIPLVTLHQSETWSWSFVCHLKMFNVIFYIITTEKRSIHISISMAHILIIMITITRRVTMPALWRCPGLHYNISSQDHGSHDQLTYQPGYDRSVDNERWCHDIVT